VALRARNQDTVSTVGRQQTNAAAEIRAALYNLIAFNNINMMARFSDSVLTSTHRTYKYSQSLPYRGGVVEII